VKGLITAVECVCGIVFVDCGHVITFRWFGRSFVVVHVENSSHTADKLRCLLKCSILLTRHFSNFGVALLYFLTSVHNTSVFLYRSLNREFS
jgi:hypothetical protein